MGFFAIVVGLGGVAVSADGMHLGNTQYGVIGAGVTFLAMLLGLGARMRQRNLDGSDASLSTDASPSSDVTQSTDASPSSDVNSSAYASGEAQDLDSSTEAVAPEAPTDPITDPLTGLMNEIFFSGLLSTKVATARRRLWPLSVVLLKLVIQPGVASEASDDAIVGFAGVVSETIRTADVACRVGSRTFALLLDDTDEDGAAWVAERIQIAHAREGESAIMKVFAGVASYPSHGIEPADILITAKSALKQASDSLDLPGLGRVIVAPQRPM